MSRRRCSASAVEVASPRLSRSWRTPSLSRPASGIVSAFCVRSAIAHVGDDQAVRPRRPGRYRRRASAGEPRGGEASPPATATLNRPTAGLREGRRPVARPRHAQRVGAWPRTDGTSRTDRGCSVSSNRVRASGPDRLPRFQPSSPGAARRPRRTCTQSHRPGALAPSQDAPTADRTPCGRLPRGLRGPVQVLPTPGSPERAPAGRWKPARGPSVARPPSRPRLRPLVRQVLDMTTVPGGHRAVRVTG